MTTRFLTALTIPVLLLTVPATAPAATVLTNFPGPATIPDLIKGTGGVLPNPLEYGFEFTVHGGDHNLITITLDMGTHLGGVPLTVELYGSASGPDAAVFLTTLTGPAQPVNQTAAFTPALPTTLSDGGTYFVRLRVNGNASSYAVNRTATAATGTWTMGNYYTRPGNTGPWNAGGFSPETVAEIGATPVSSVPEPPAALPGVAGVFLTFRRRR